VSGLIQAVRAKTAGSHVFRGNFSGLVSATDPLKRHGKSCSLHLKKNFFGWGADFL